MLSYTTPPLEFSRAKMPSCTSPASTARSTPSVDSSSTISMSPSRLSLAYSSAASSENDPRMPITPTRVTSPTAGPEGEGGQLGGEPLGLLQGDVVAAVVEPRHPAGRQGGQGAGGRRPAAGGGAEQHRAAEPRVQRLGPLGEQRVDHLHVVVEGEAGARHALVVHHHPGPQEFADPLPLGGGEAVGAGEPARQRHREARL